MSQGETNFLMCSQLEKCYFRLSGFADLLFRKIVRNYTHIKPALGLVQLQKHSEIPSSLDHQRKLGRHIVPRLIVLNPIALMIRSNNY